MLEAPNCQPARKSHHSATLIEQSDQSPTGPLVQHQNISAVLDELGLPWIPGYKPKRNYQGAIFDAIDRYLSGDERILNSPVPDNTPDPASEAIFVEPPPLAAKRRSVRPRLVNFSRNLYPV